MAGVTLRATFPGYAQQPGQQDLAAVLYAKDAELGFAVPVTLTGASSDSSLLIVPGVNSFMAMVDVGASAATYTIQWLHCDPDTGAVLFTRQIATGQAAGTIILFPFGAYGAAAAGMLGDVFHSGILRLFSSGANITLNHLRLWAGKR
jgi:hypothetical protein